MSKFFNISTDATLGGASPSDETVSSQKAVKAYVDAQSGGGVSLDAGMLASFATTTAPAGWLVCDGSAVSRTSYADLFAAIGTTYGAGDESTTFNLPDLSGKLPLYDGTATQGATTNGKAPNIYGTAAPHGGSRGTAGAFTGAFYATGVQQESGASISGSGGRWGFDASRCSGVYDGSATSITPAGVYTLWCIKY